MEVTELKHRNLVLAAARNFLHLYQHNADANTTIFSYFPATCAFLNSVISTNIVYLL